MTLNHGEWLEFAETELDWTIAKFKDKNQDLGGNFSIKEAFDDSTLNAYYNIISRNILKSPEKIALHLKI